MLSMDADTGLVAVTRVEEVVVEAVMTRSREVAVFPSVARMLDAVCDPRHLYET